MNLLHPNETYQDFTDYLWANIILKLGFNRGASTVTVIVDKTEIFAAFEKYSPCRKES